MISSPQLYGVESAESPVLNGGQPGDFTILYISLWSISLYNYWALSSYSWKIKIQDIQDSWLYYFHLSIKMYRRKFVICTEQQNWNQVQIGTQGIKPCFQKTLCEKICYLVIRADEKLGLNLQLPRLCAGLSISMCLDLEYGSAFLER